MNESCPICGCEVCNDLGTLGNLHYVRCVACGTDYAIDPELVALCEEYEVVDA